jgi:hypothetical protein
VDPKAGLGDVEKKKKFDPTETRTPTSRSFRHVLYLKAYLSNGSVNTSPLLSGRSLIHRNRRSLLRNDSVNTFTMQWIHAQEYRYC